MDKSITTFTRGWFSYTQKQRREVVTVAKLTAKQKKFCLEYLIDLNATQAAIRAGYSAKTAYRIGAELLQKTSVSEYLSALQKKQSKRTEITADRVLSELAAIAFADTTKIARIIHEPLRGAGGALIYDEYGNLVCEPTVEYTDTEKLDGESKKAISGIKQGRNGPEVTMYDKQKALELLGKHLGMFKDKQQDDEDKGAVIIDDV